MKENNWNKIKNKLSKSFNWNCQFVIKKSKKGKAIDGIITGVMIGIQRKRSKKVQ